MFPSIWRCSNPDNWTRQYSYGVTASALELDREYAGMSDELPGTGPSAHVTPAVIVKCDSCDLARVLPNEQSRKLNLSWR
jgi:hypothetical protein